MSSSEALSANASGKSDVAWHESHPLSVNRAQVGVFEEADEKALSCFLESKESLALEAHLVVAPSGDVTHKSLKRQSWDDGINRLLEALDLLQGLLARSMSLQGCSRRLSQLRIGGRAGDTVGDVAWTGVLEWRSLSIGALMISGGGVGRRHRDGLPLAFSFLTVGSTTGRFHSHLQTYNYLLTAPYIN